MLKHAAKKANGYWLFVNGYLLFVDSGGFGLSSPDRRTEDAGKLATFLDQVLDQDDWGHPSFQKDEQPDAGLIELFDGDSEFMYEVGTALCSSRFSLVPGGRNTRTQDLAGNMTPGRCFRQAPDHFNNLYRKRHQPSLKRVGSSLRHSILLAIQTAFPSI